ncbi:family 18 glycoside hydrolase [Xylaria sp. CBS 124048]|nr:family 18 glycoside hydrolase [Xylaria sp. CBS 124048]
MRISQSVAAAGMAGMATATSRFAMYYDQWHLSMPQKGNLVGITHAITAFADPLLFTTSPPGPFTPFVDPNTLRASFDAGTKMCLAVGGWGFTAGYSAAQGTNESRALFAKNIADTLVAHGYDCVDVDWEYPGGNGEDYKTNPNPGKVGEIDTYPLLLQAIKSAIGSKELSIAVPGLERDFRIAYTAEKVPLINSAVDVVNVMTYDLMNRRDNTTRHHSSVQGSLDVVEKYIALGMDPGKMNLGIALYAKYFATVEPCTQPIGCKTAVLEDANGRDTGLSGAQTFRQGIPATVLANGTTDETEGGQWYWDPTTSNFWTWDTPALISQKLEKIVKAKKLGGVMGWSLGEDGADNAYIKAMRDGMGVSSTNVDDASPCED